MGATTKSAKPPKKLVEAVRRALTDGHGDEVARAWHVRRALEDAEPAIQRAIATVIVADAPVGLTRHWLGTLAVDGDRGASARALAEDAAAVTGGRGFVTDLLSGAAPLVADDALLLRAIKNLVIARPFAPLFLERGIEIARREGDAVAAELAARAAFAQRHRDLLGDLRDRAQEKKQKAAVARLDTLTPEDRSLAALWLLTEPDVDRDAKRWARIAGFLDPDLDVPVIAWAFADGSGIHDEELTQIADQVTAAGEPGLARVVAILGHAVDHQLGATIQNLAAIAPTAFGTTGGFAHVERALQSGDTTARSVCERMRVINAAFDDAQAARIVELLIALVGAPGRCDVHALGRGFFYLRHPGALPAIAAAFEREPSDAVVDALYDCLGEIETPGAYDLLIDRMFVERRKVRDLIFALTSGGGGAARHKELLGKLDLRRSIHGAWVALAVQLNWGHRPKAALEIVERILAWTDAVDRDEQKLAYLYGQGIRCALELKRYAFAKTLLAALHALPSDAAVDPTSTDTRPALDAATKQLAAKLASGELEATLAARRAAIDAARAAGTPIEADDELLGVLGSCQVKGRIHADPATREVWFLDAEGQYVYYDGYDIASVPVWTYCGPDEEYGTTSRELAAFAQDFRIEDRALCYGDGGHREIVRCDERLIVRIARFDRAFAGHTFVMRPGSEERARQVFASFAHHAMAGTRVVDPFYVPGKRGGTFVRKVAGTKLWRVGCDVRDGGTGYGEGTTTSHASEAAARAAFDELEVQLLRRGTIGWQLELDGEIRPLADNPLLAWIEDRARDDARQPAWHVEALPEIVAALVRSGLPLDDVEVELGTPASEHAITAYDATLPTPMPDALRALWQAHATARWRVGATGERLIGPDEVLSSRDRLRARLRELAARYAPKQLAAWPLDHMDVLVVDRDDQPTMAWDVRQHSHSCYADVSPNQLKRPDWWDSLAWMLAVGINHDFVRALVERFPQIKKLSYGQHVDTLGAKPNAHTKPKAQTQTQIKTQTQTQTKTQTKTKTKTSAAAKPVKKSKAARAARAAKAKPEAKPRKGKR